MPALCQELIDFCQHADLLIHDAQYTEEEYLGLSGPPRKGWGHCMWKEAVDVAIQAEVKQLALFHHDPSRSDDDVFKIEKQAQHYFPKTFAACEQMTVEL